MKYFFQLLMLLLTTNLVAQNGIALVGNIDEDIIRNINTTETGALESSFELFDRMIVVEAILNGRLGKYILDTGSPMLILNQVPQEKSTSLGGISDEGDAEFVKVQNFQWAGILNKEIDAVAYDLSQLEKALGYKINGLIGQNIFKNYELFLDVSNRKIQLFKSYRSQLHKRNKHKQKISFSNKSHIPIITVKIDGKKYRFGIDTGAEVNVLNKHLKGSFGNDILKNFKSSNLHGLGGVNQEVESAELSNFKIRKKDCENYEFLLTDLTSFEEKYGQKLDGILGYPFLLNNILSINYQKQKIYIW